MARQSVDFPEPEGPMTTTTSPRATETLMSPQDVQVAEPLVDTIEHDEGRALR